MTDETQQMSDAAFDDYLQANVMAYVSHPKLMSAEAYRALLILLEYVSADEEADLKARESNGQDVSEHIHHEIKALADWARLQKQ